MTQYENEKKLVESLIVKTEAKKISWSEAVSQGNPEAQIGDHTIVLEEGRNANGATLFFVVVLDKMGREIERFDDEDLDQPERGTKYYELLNGLYTKASRQARGAEKAIDDLLRNISEL
jgi:hypothetical protein